MGMIKDPTSWRVGFELGLAGFSFPYSKPRKPTAYLYNGIRLPALPEWDRGVYPFAFIEYWTGYARLYVSDTPVGINTYKLTATSDYTKTVMGPRDGEAWKRMEAALMSNGEFVSDPAFWEAEENSEPTTICGRSDVLWANYDVYDYVQSETFLTASDPVPVYE